MTTDVSVIFSHDVHVPYPPVSSLRRFEDNGAPQAAVPFWFCFVFSDGDDAMLVRIQLVQNKSEYLCSHKLKLHFRFYCAWVTK